MNITMQLIWDRLLEREGVRKYGFLRSVPLHRPELLSDNMETMSGHIYVAEASAIPDDKIFDRNALVVCAGNKESGLGFHGRYPFFVVPGSLAEVFNRIAAIYDWYDRWDRKLQQILNEDANPSSLLQVSLPVIGNTLYLNDNKLNFIGKILKADNAPTMTDVKYDPSNSVKGVLLLPYAESIRERIQKHGYDINPRLFMENGVPMYGIDLFFGKMRIGSLSMAASKRPFKDGDPELLCHLARCLETALSKKNDVLETQAISHRDLLIKLLNDVNVSEESIRRIIQSSGENTERFRCILIRTINGSGQLQSDYLCRLIESTFHGLIAVEYNGNIVVLFDSVSVVLPEQEFFSRMRDLLAPLRLNAGISRSFQNLSDFKEFYRQSAAALDTVDMPEPGSITFFEKSILQYMIKNACGEFSPVTLYPSGLLKLKEYCRTSDVDYMQVLRIWLDSGCNVSEAARRLYLHRSTFIKRMDRIREILSLDLEDPEDLLWLRLSMHLIEYREKLS